TAPPPTLTTAIQISRRSPIPPPPPPRNKNHDIPLPPPRPADAAAPSSATTELQRRVQELFSGEAAQPVPVVFTPPPPPPPSKRPLLIDDAPEEDDDDDFVIRDTLVEEDGEPAAKQRKYGPSPPPAPPKAAQPFEEEDQPKAINKIEEKRRKEAIAEERRRRAMELGDGEYDPMETSTAADESTLVYEYQPTNTEEAVEEEVDDEEMDEGEEEEGDDEEAEEEEEEEEEEDVEEEEEEEQGDVEEEEKNLQEEPDDVDVDGDGPLDIHRDAREILKLALPVLQSFSTATDAKKDQYAQLDSSELAPDSMQKRQDDEAPAEVYYHGEPVPEVDENELYEIAAGIKPKKKEKKALVQIPEEERLPADFETIELDYYNADIHVKSGEKNIWQIEPFNQDGLALMWGGVRSNFGVQLPFKKTDKDKASKLAFQIEIEAYQSIQHLPTEFMSDGGDVRLGFALESSPLALGEYPGSWCISGSGKRAMNNHFSEFGHSFDIGDVVTCILDLENSSISYNINGQDVGTPFERISWRSDDLIFPTICTKNANINVNLGQDLTDEKWKIPEDRDWMFITEMDRAHLVRTRVAPETKKDCTVLVTVGLPGAGKTTWVRRYLAEHPHEHWTLISADIVMDAMKVNGVPRIRLPTLKRPDFLRGICGKSMARLIMLAPRRRKNYILDMSNCIADKRKRKLMAFEEFNRKCMIFVPDEDTHQKRLIKQEHEENEKLDTDAMMQHKATMSLPSIEAGDPCEEVIFIDPPAPHEQLAFDRVSKMNYECRSWLQVPNRRGRGGGGGGYHHNNYRGGGGYRASGSGQTSGQPGGGNNQYSPRPMNITHTTFLSNNSSSFARGDEVQIEPIILPPVKISAQTLNFTAAAQPSPVTEVNLDVSQPLTLNTGMHSAHSSGSHSASYSNSPLFGFPPKEPHTPTTSTSIPPMHRPPPIFPIDVTVPPPNFSAPPPPLPGMAPSPMLMQQMSVPPPTQQPPSQFTYPPPQFTPR
uniref:B30.2/SPRY domain-containing protein n=1 Tax=Caenorhabditis japonica TaxID=281687 RepID=A0A8R1I2T7_CAEJA